MGQICFSKDYFYLIFICVIGTILYFIIKKEGFANLKTEIDIPNNQYQLQMKHDILNRMAMSRQDDYIDIIDQYQPSTEIMWPYNEPYRYGNDYNNRYNDESHLHYEQYGILINPSDSKLTIPLYGKHDRRSNHIKYSTSSHYNPSIILPINTKNKKELKNDEAVIVPGYENMFKVHLYEHEW